MIAGPVPLAPVLLAHVQLGAAMALVGLNVAVSKLLAQALPVAVLLFLRCLLACAVLAPFVRPRPPPRAVAWNLASQAALGTVLYNAALLAGLRRTGALEAGLVLASLPAVVALGAAALLGERMSGRGWLAVALAAGGMAALACARGGAGGGTVTGGALVFLAVCGEAGYVLLAKRSAGRVGLLQAVFWMQAASAALLAPFALPDLGAAAWDARLAGLLVFHALTASVFAVVLWYAGLRRVGAAQAGVFTGLLPLTAGAVAVAALGEAPTAAHGAGAVLMFGSILLATWPGREPPLAPGTPSRPDPAGVRHRR